MEKATTTELKAAIYDRIVVIEKLQAEIKALNEEISRRPIPEIPKVGTKNESNPTTNDGGTNKTS